VKFPEEVRPREGTELAMDLRCALFFRGEEEDEEEEEETKLPGADR
jgi:hypothetical protein